MLMTLKGLPLAYNKDMQEDKEGLFDAVHTLKGSLRIFEGMIEHNDSKRRAFTRNCIQ